MAIWNPWRGCHRYSEGCMHCYIHKGDAKRGVDTNNIIKTKQFYAPIAKNRNGDYKMKANQLVYVCFQSDFLLEEGDAWRNECWAMIKQRCDLTFLFLTKRIERFANCLPEDWGKGYENVIVGCTIENQKQADIRLPIFKELPILHRNIIAQPLLSPLHIRTYLKDVELVVVGGESDKNGRVMDYDWVLDIRKQCQEMQVPFEFRQCATHFIKDGKLYHLPVRELVKQAKKAAIDG